MFGIRGKVAHGDPRQALNALRKNQPAPDGPLIPKEGAVAPEGVVQGSAGAGAMRGGDTQIGGGSGALGAARGAMPTSGSLGIGAGAMGEAQPESFGEAAERVLRQQSAGANSRNLPMRDVLAALEALRGHVGYEPGEDELAAYVSELMAGDPQI